MADNNNQRAQNFAGGFSRKNIDGVGFGSKKADQVALLEDIRELVAAAAQDMYGGQDDPKYIYIVNLILKRIKAALNDIGLDASLKDIKQKLDDSISLSKEQSSVKSDVQTILSKADKIYTKIHEYNELRKEEYDAIKTSLKQLIDANNQKKQSNDSGIAQEKLATEEQLDVVMTQVNETLFKMTQLCNVAIPAINTRLDTLQTNIDTGFSTAMQNITNTSEVLNNAINDVDAGIKMTICNAEANIIDAIGQSATTSIFGKISSIFSSVISGAIRKISGLFTKGFKAIGKTFGALKNGIGKVFSATTESVKASFFAAGKGIKKVFGAIGSLGFGIKGMFKKRTKGLKKMQSSIEDSISAMGAMVAGAMSAVMGPIGLAVKVMFGALKLVLKPLQWILKLFTNPIMLVLFLAGTLFVLYKFFRPTFDKLVKKVSGWISKAVEIYQTKIQPAIDVVKKIMGDDTIPLGERIKLAAKEGGKVLYKKFFPKGILQFFKDLWVNTLLPLLKDTVIPFIKNNWKTIFATIGIAWLVGNPLSAISLTLKGLQIGISALKLGVGAVKGGIAAAKVAASGGAALVKGLGTALVGMGPVGWAAIGTAAVIGGAFYYLWKKNEEANAALAASYAKEASVIRERQDKAQAVLDGMYATQQETFQHFGKILKNAGIDKVEDSTPELYDLGDGTVLDKASFDEYIKNASTNADENVKTVNAKFEQFVKDEKFKDFDPTSMTKGPILGFYYSKAKLLIDGAKGFLKSYIDDKANHINDATLPARFAAAMASLNEMESHTYKKLDWYAGELESTFASGSNDDWRQQLEGICGRIQSESRDILEKFLTRPDGSAAYGKTAKGGATDIMNKMSRQVQAIAHSRNVDDIKKALADPQKQINTYADSAGKKFTDAAMKAQEQLDKALNKENIFKDTTAVQKEARKQLSDLVRNASRNAVAHGKKLDAKELEKIQQEAIAQIYRESVAKLKENPQDAALKDMVQKLEKRSAIVKSEMQKMNLENDFDALAKNGLAGLEGVDKEKLNSSVKAALSNLYDQKVINGSSKLDNMSAQQQAAVLDEIKKQLAEQKVEDKDKEKMMEALGKLLKNTEEIKNKEPDKTTVVSNNVISVPQKQNLATNSKRGASTVNRLDPSGFKEFKDF